MKTRKNVLKGLARIVAGAGLGGLMAILPASQISCTNSRAPVVYKEYKEQEAAYNFGQELKRENPKAFKKSYGNDSIIYHDSSLKFGNDSLIRGFPESGKGRFVDISKDGRINAGYWGDKEKVVAFSYEPEKQEIIIAEGNTLTYLKKGDAGWEKRTYSGSVPEGMKFEDIPFRNLGKADKNEVQKWLDLVREISGKFSAKRTLQ
ncbi:hypothetical protein FJZ19_03145 [Candidatus Pacearchaeota archaeon]|nr:hypothetical protein [Candidatus Pacearchaeota archaeon]